MLYRFYIRLIKCYILLYGLYFIIFYYILFYFNDILMNIKLFVAVHFFNISAINLFIHLIKRLSYF